MHTQFIASVLRSAALMLVAVAIVFAGFVIADSMNRSSNAQIAAQKQTSSLSAAQQQADAQTVANASLQASLSAQHQANLQQLAANQSTSSQDLAAMNRAALSGH
jgi:hypothetical protein